MKYRASITLDWEFEAESPEEAKRLAAREQESLAGSNDGSEMLANARINVVEI